MKSCQMSFNEYCSMWITMFHYSSAEEHYHKIFNIQNDGPEVKADSLRTCPNPKMSATCKEEVTMSITVTNPTFINGAFSDSISTDELLNLIAKSKRRAAELTGMGIESKTVAALIAKEEKGIAAAIVVLDSREVK